LLRVRAKTSVIKNHSVGGILGYISIVFGALSLLLPPLAIAIGNLWLTYVGLAAAIIGGILGVMSRATKEGKAGLILSVVAVLSFGVGIAVFIPHSSVVQPGDATVATPPAK